MYETPKVYLFWIVLKSPCELYDLWSFKPLPYWKLSWKAPKRKPAPTSIAMLNFFGKPSSS